MKVLRIADIPCSAEGGMGGALIHSGDALRKLGIQVDYLYRDDIGDLPTTPQARRLIAPWLVVLAVARIHRKGNIYDVVEIHEPLAAGYCVLGPILGLPPCAVLSHGLEMRYWAAQLARWQVLGRTASLKSRITVPLTLLSQCKFALRHAEQVIVLTLEDVEYLETTLLLDPSQISRVDNGAPQVTTVTRVPTSTARILFFGSWIDRKGISELVDAATVLAASGITFQLTVAGTGTGTAEVLSAFPRQLRRLVEVRPRVRRSEVSSLLESQDILVAPSWAEGMPLTVLEAASAGLALVLTDISGHRQIMRGSPDLYASGVLIPPHDGVSLGNALIELIRDPDRLRTLQASSRSLALELSWDHAARQLLVAYEQAMAVSKQRRRRIAISSIGAKRSTRRVM